MREDHAIFPNDRSIRELFARRGIIIARELLPNEKIGAITPLRKGVAIEFRYGGSRGTNLIPCIDTENVKYAIRDQSYYRIHAYLRITSLRGMPNHARLYVSSGWISVPYQHLLDELKGCLVLADQSKVL